MLERNILFFLNHRLNFVTPAEVTTSFMQLIHFRKSGAVASDQEFCRDDFISANFCTDVSLSIMITFYCLSSK